MNSLLLFPDEVLPSGKAVMQHSRLADISSRFHLGKGVEHKAALLNESCGIFTPTKITDTSIEGEYQRLKERALTRLPLSIAVAIPRPPTVKKILHFAAQVGLKKIIFFRAERSVKSYLQSKQLLQENIDREIQLALEQSWDCIAPEVVICNSLTDLLEDVTAQSALVLETSAEPSFLESNDSKAPSELLFGPEQGWSDHELKLFCELNVPLANLGKRIYRVETAVSLCTGAYLFKRII